jgi:hypothetical protein
MSSSFQLIFNGLMDDHQPDIFNPPATELDKSGGDYFVELLFGGLHRWDSLYFLHVAEHGYTYEKTIAFFPGFPLFARAGIPANTRLLYSIVLCRIRITVFCNDTFFSASHTLLRPLLAYLSLRHVLMISAFIVNACAFTLATWYLFRLGRLLIGKGKLSPLKI